jgi:predicted nucleic acid-binding protein
MISRVVLDASAGVEAVLAGPRAAKVLRLLEACPLVLVPGLYACEVANALWKYVRAGDLTREEALPLVEAALGLADRAVPDHELAPEALSSAAAAGHPVYDLVYAVLARRFGCTVVTTDRRFPRLLAELGIPAWTAADAD